VKQLRALSAATTASVLQFVQSSSIGRLVAPRLCSRSTRGSSTTYKLTADLGRILVVYLRQLLEVLK